MISGLLTLLVMGAAVALHLAKLSQVGSVKVARFSFYFFVFLFAIGYVVHSLAGRRPTDRTDEG